jgi:hypothetical protein
MPGLLVTMLAPLDLQSTELSAERTFKEAALAVTEDAPKVFSVQALSEEGDEYHICLYDNGIMDAPAGRINLLAIYSVTNGGGGDPHETAHIFTTSVRF